LRIHVTSITDVTDGEAHQRRLELPDSLLHIAEGVFREHQVQGFDDVR